MGDQNISASDSRRPSQIGSTNSNPKEPSSQGRQLLEGRENVSAGTSVLEDTTNAAVASSQPVVFRTYKRRWFGIIQMFLLNLAVNWGWLTFAPVSSQAAEYYNTSTSGVNWLSIAYQFAFCICAPFTVKVLHYGPKPSFMAASILLLIGNWIRYAGSHSQEGGTYGVVLFAQVLIGLAQPFILSAPTCYSDMWFTEKGRVGATALATLSNPLGAALAQLITPFWVSDASDISNAVLYVSIIASIASIPTFFIPARPPVPVSHTSETVRPPIKEALVTLARTPEIWLIVVPFAVYIGLFNNISSLLNQMLEPYGLSEDEAGIGGAVLIVAGLVCSAITSPIFDKHKKFLVAIKCAVPIIAAMYIAFIWMPETGSITGPYIVLAILGAASFSLIPVALEFLAELSYPIGSEITSTLSWSLGQLMGAIFIVVSDRLEAGGSANPPHHMKNSLIFQAVVGAAVVPLPLMLGLFGRATKTVLKRNASAEEFHQNARIIREGQSIESTERPFNEA